MDQDIIKEILKDINILKDKIEKIDKMKVKEQAPESIAIDLTSEDCDGIFMAARPGMFLNMDTNYIRVDLAGCDYYESYLKEVKRVDNMMEIALDIVNCHEWLMDSPGDVIANEELGYSVKEMKRFIEELQNANKSR